MTGYFICIYSNNNLFYQLYLIMCFIIRNIQMSIMYMFVVCDYTYYTMYIYSIHIVNHIPLVI